VTTPLILLGLGGNVVDILDLVDDLNQAPPQPSPAGAPSGAPYEVLGYLDDREAMQGRTLHDLPVLGRFADARGLVERHPAARLTTWIGGVDSYHRRPQVIDAVGLPLERYQTLVHPTAYVSPRARVGRGVLIYQHCTINNSAVIEDHAVILPQSVLSHDCVLREYAVVTSSVTVGSSAHIGRCSYLGTRCCMLPGVRIGEGSLVGIGSVVLRDVDPYTVVVGTPARRLRDARRPDAS
jgi:sugar O-acyltransferase (sialic acid O-acetyltransferase NeuD family)